MAQFAFGMTQSMPDYFPSQKINGVTFTDVADESLI